MARSVADLIITAVVASTDDAVRAGVDPWARAYVRSLTMSPGEVAGEGPGAQAHREIGDMIEGEESHATR